MTGRARAEALMSEADFQRRVIETAKLHGWRVAHYRPALTRKGTWSTPVTGHRGAPDLLLARAGAVVLAELKSEAGKPGPGQPEWLAALGEHGRLWKPSQWLEIVEELR